MMKLKMIALVAIVIGANPTQAASLQVLDDTNWGVGSIVYDTVTGLEWLKPIETVGQSYNQIASLMTTDKFSGFYYADHNQISQLFIDAGLPIINQSQPQNSYGNRNPDPSEQYLFKSVINMFGATLNDSPFIISVNGISADFYPSVDQTGSVINNHFISYIIYSNGWIAPGVIYTSDSIGSNMRGGATTFANISLPENGSWLIRQHFSTTTIPEPSSLTLLASGLIGLGASFRKNIIRY